MLYLDLLLSNALPVTVRIVFIYYYMNSIQIREAQNTLICFRTGGATLGSSGEFGKTPVSIFFLNSWTFIHSGFLYLWHNGERNGLERRMLSGTRNNTSYSRWALTQAVMLETKCHHGWLIPWYKTMIVFLSSLTAAMWSLKPQISNVQTGTGKSLL